MKMIPRFLITTAALFGALSVSVAQQTEKTVTLKTADGKIITTAAQGGLELGRSQNPGRQTFTLVDSNGGDLADGDDVKIRYNPGGSSKPNYWKSSEGKLGRSDKGDTFKLKKVEDKYLFQTSDGKFVAPPSGGSGGLTLADSQEGALKVEIAEAAAAAAPSASASAQ